MDKAQTGQEHLPWRVLKSYTNASGIDQL